MCKRVTYLKCSCSTGPQCTCGNVHSYMCSIHFAKHANFESTNKPLIEWLCQKCGDGFSKPSARNEHEDACVTEREEKHTDWIQTYSGVRFYPLEPEASAVRLEDVAHALALKCRYNGHCSEFYSVAQHSVLMSEQVDDPELAMWALLHDAGEAYLADIPRPVKPFTLIEMSPGANHRFERIENRVREAVLMALAPSLAQTPEPAYIKELDTRILLDEAQVIMGLQNKSTWGALQDVEPLGIEVTPWGWRHSKNAFLNRYHTLKNYLA